MWYLIVSIPDRCRLSYFVLASHRYCSTHCVDLVDNWEKKKLNCKNYHFQELCFSKVSNVRSTSASFGEPHLSLILTNQCLTIMVRSGTVINIVPLWWHCPCADPEGDRESGHPPPPWKITSTYMGFKYFTDRSKAVLLLWIFYVFCSVLCWLCLCARLFICALWSPSGKGLTSWLSFVVSTMSLSLSIGILGQVWYLIVSIPDLCTLTYFLRN